MKKVALVLFAILLTISCSAQKSPKFTEEDAKQFYRTLEGDYSLYNQNDSIVAMVHFTPIWETPDKRFQWLYVEASRGKDVVFQKVLEVVPKTDKLFSVVMHGLKNPQQFVGKWGNRNYFDGFTTNILSGKTKVSFVKTSDFSYQMNGFKRIKSLEGCFEAGDMFHFKFVQEDERFYLKRMPVGTNRILGYQGIKELTD